MEGDMTTTMLELMLPVRLPADFGVKAWLFHDPSAELSAELNRITFTRIGYADERLGDVGRLDELEAVAKAGGNSIYKVETVSDRTSDDIVGDLLAHARVYVPVATSATFAARPTVHRGTRVVTLNGERVAWAPGLVRVS